MAGPVKDIKDINFVEKMLSVSMKKIRARPFYFSSLDLFTLTLQGDKIPGVSSTAALQMSAK